MSLFLSFVGSQRSLFGKTGEGSIVSLLRVLEL